MKELNLRLSFALLVLGLGLVAGVTEVVRMASPEVAVSSAELRTDGMLDQEGGAQSGGGSGGDSEPTKVRWTSLIPGSFK